MTGLPPLDSRTIAGAYERALARKPDAVAQIDRDGQWTFAESHARSLTLAGGLASLGLGRGEPVAVMLDNSLDTVHLWSGVGLGGMVEVPVNTTYKGRFMRHVLNDSGARVLVLESAYCQRLAAIAGELDHLSTVVVRGGYDGELEGLGFAVVDFAEMLAARALSPVPLAGSDLFALMYTSGTTGQSKGVMVPHAHAYTYGSREDLGTDGEDDRVLVTLPIFHFAGLLSGVYGALIHRSTLVLEPVFSVSRFWPLVRQQRITRTGLLGAMAELLQQQPRRPDDADNPLVSVGCSPLPSNLDEFRRRFGVEVTTAYGMSEIGRVMDGGPDGLVPGSAGTGRPGYELRLVDEAGRDIDGPGTGELWVRPTVPFTVMTGYHNLPEKTAETIVDGWTHTGDVFRRDDDGNWYFLDRMKDALRRRGENVSSFEVESVINEHPAVLESAVVAVPSPLTEDDIKAVIVLREGTPVEPEELLRFLIDRLPYFMVPRYLEYVAELPKTPTQKIQKNLLRESGVSGEVWDREAAGIRVTRDS